MTRADVVLIAVLVVVALLAWPVAAGADGGPATGVVIEGPDGVTAVRLDRDGDYRVVGARGVVLVVVSGGTVAIRHSDCPDHICVRTGSVSEAGATIACVPNKVVVRVAGEDADGLDARIR